MLSDVGLPMNDDQPADSIELHLPWLSELALRKFEYADRAFDTCNARAGAVIGFA